MNQRRVGSFSLGCVLILMGTLYLLHLVIPSLSYEVIFRFWPAVLILLGGEILVANCHHGDKTFEYDLGGIILMFLVVCFSCGMGLIDYMMQHSHTW